MQIKHISTSEVIARVKKGAVLLDIRSADAYNGWQLMQEHRGGHIRGARSLPFKWTNYIDWMDIIQQKNITPDKEIIIYGYSNEENGILAELFIKAGFHNINIYGEFLSEWVPDEHLPMDRLARYRNLVPAEWLNKMISGETITETHKQRPVVIQAHYRNRDAYLSGHIPGAVDMDTLVLESP
ncbi:MAG: thiosulfate sulfurtransferase, partial [FCB group bacterium]|nr:thiosulfate sulfurtransferase [FCB group bacterium]